MRMVRFWRSTKLVETFAGSGRRDAHRLRSNADPADPSNHPAQPLLLRTRVYTPPTSHFLFNSTSPYFYEYPTNSNCVSVSRGTFQPRRFSRQSIKEDAVHHGAPQDDQPQRNLQSSPAISPIAFLIVTLAIKNQHIFRKTKAAHAF
jgi:hypothetical protein